MEDRPWQWLTNTAPFSARDDATRPANFIGEQVWDKDFRLP